MPDGVLLLSKTFLWRASAALMLVQFKGLQQKEPELCPGIVVCSERAEKSELKSAV
jgi:hypothetical protein